MWRERDTNHAHFNGQSLLIWVNKRHQESGKKCWGRMLWKSPLSPSAGAPARRHKYIEVAHHRSKMRNIREQPGRLGADEAKRDSPWERPWNLGRPPRPRNRSAAGAAAVLPDIELRNWPLNKTPRRSVFNKLFYHRLLLQIQHGRRGENWSAVLRLDPPHFPLLRWRRLQSEIAVRWWNFKRGNIKTICRNWRLRQAIQYFT